MSDEPGSSTVSIDVAMLDAAWGQCIAEAEATVSQVAAVCLRRALPDWAARRLLEVSIVLTDDRQVRELNARHRGRDKPTNVLSFPAIDWGVEAEREPAPEDHQEDQSSENAAPLLLGDVVVARETLLAEAKAQEKEPRNHLAHLVAHGTLHLLGYDHEEDSAAERMEALEVSVLQSLGVPDPYAVREGRPPLASQGPAARRNPGLQKQDNKILAS